MHITVYNCMQYMHIFVITLDLLSVHYTVYYMANN